MKKDTKKESDKPELSKTIVERDSDGKESINAKGSYPSPSLPTHKDRELDYQITLPEDMPMADKLIRLLPHYKTINQAAIAAGYSEAYAGAGVYMMIKKTGFQAKLREYYQTESTTLLPSILHIEQQVVEMCANDVNNVPKFRSTLKELKQSTGVLASDPTPGTTTININNVRDFMLELGKERKKVLHNDRTLDQNDENWQEGELV